MGGQRFAVVDVETTGLYNSDRVVEVGVVLVADGGVVIDEYETLVDPARDVGPTDVHGITASMVSNAPRFEEIVSTLADLLDGCTFVAHNASFDARFLVNEFDRVGVGLNIGAPICTLSLTASRLNLACEERGIAHDEQHRALADARATAALFAQLVAPAATSGIEIVGRLPPAAGRTSCRPGSGTSAKTDLMRVVERVRYPSERPAIITYLDALDWALNDLVIDEEEAEGLYEVATALGISAAEMERAHDRYLDALIEAVERDGIVTEDEERLLASVSRALGLRRPLPVASSLPQTRSLPSDGQICFTGAAELPRAELEAYAERVGLTPHSGVTKRTAVLVAADTTSASGKAKKARAYGIPVLSVAEFLALVGEA